MKTAVLVIDMQNGFVHPEGSLPANGFGLPDMPAVIAENGAMIAAARAKGLPIIYTRHVYRGDRIEMPRSMQERQGELDRPSLIRGSWDADVVDELRPHGDDYIVDKNRFDAFLYTDLEVVLRGLGVKQLLVSGVVTSVCVESTVRSGYQRDFDIMVAADCTSAPPQFHTPSLEVMAELFAQVGDWRSLLDSVSPIGAPPLAATPAPAVLV